MARTGLSADKYRGREVVGRAPYVAAFILLFAALGARAEAPVSDADIRETVEFTLTKGNPDEGPDFWRGLGPRAPRVLIAMAEASIDPARKMRLVQAVGALNDPAAIAYVKKQARESESGLVRNAAIETVGVVHGVREAEFVAEFLSSPDPQTRLTADRTLRAMANPRAQALLDRHPRVAVPSPSPRPSPRPVLSLTEWVGDWRGFWVNPSSQVSDVVTVRLLLGQGVLAGTVTAGDKVYKLTARGAASHVSGSLGTVPENRVEADLSPERMLTIRVFEYYGESGSLIVLSPLASHAQR